MMCYGLGANQNSLPCQACPYQPKTEDNLFTRPKGHLGSAMEGVLASAERRNSVIDLSGAEAAIVAATKSGREDIQILAGQILARLAGAGAQQAITAMALAKTNNIEVQILAFDSLAISAKLNGSLLDGASIDTIYTLVSSQDIEPGLRGAAAAAYGALNLPSQKVKDLILDQSRS